MQRATVGALMAVTIACGGCRGMRDSYTRGPDLWLKVNVGKPGKPSARTVDTLREVDLEKDYYRDPAGTRTALAAQFASQPRRDWCYALADLSFAEGQKAEAAGNTECTEHFYRAIQYSYAYLTAPEIPEPLSPLDPRTRLACDLYNGSLARLICQAKKVGRFDPQRRLVAPIGRGTLDCPVAHRGFPYQPEEFDDLVPAEQAKATELGRDVRTYGLGVPMVGLRKRPEPCEPKDKYLINCHPFAVTALLRPETRSLFAEEVINRHAESELHAVADALHHRMAEAGSRRLPKSAQFERVSYRGPTVE
ncbi:MAG TPA: hypothetical protein VNC50_19825, partial [Planctomycetia bacterium]|nr:hypothetical protein [Planctomycetia bacterium]